MTAGAHPFDRAIKPIITAVQPIIQGRKSVFGGAFITRQLDGIADAHQLVAPPEVLRRHGTPSFSTMSWNKQRQLSPHWNTAATDESTAHIDDHQHRQMRTADLAMPWRREGPACAISSGSNMIERRRLGLTVKYGENVRKSVPALLITGLTVAVVGIGTQAAAADTTGPTVNWANSVNDDLGRIQVSVASPAGVTGLAAHIVSPSTKAEVAVTTSFHLTSGTVQAGIWQSDEVVLPNLGYYRLNVEASDAAGGHTEADGVGTFTYAVSTYFADLETTPTLTYTQRNYTVAGKLMGRWPGTGAVAPVPGMPVYAEIPGGDFTDTVATGSAGEFSLSGLVSTADDGPGFVSTISDNNHPYYLQGYSNVPAAKVEPAATRVSIHLDRNSIISGQPITVSGNASWKSPNGWAPMANASIAIGVCPRGQSSPSQCLSGPTTSTDANGHYSYVVSPYDGDSIKVAVSSADVFVQSVAYASATITVLMPSSFRGFYANRDAQTGRVYVGATALDLTAYTPVDTVVSVQFSQNGVTGWRKVGTIDLGSNPQTSFSQAFDHSGAGYWRLTYAGAKGLLEPAQSDAVYVAGTPNGSV